jgi:hypothetical protein
MTLVDPTGYILTTIRDDAGVAALTDRVRGGGPQGGDALPVGQWRRFVVVVRMGRARNMHSPLQWVRLAARCYGAGKDVQTAAVDAAALASAVSDAVHNRGHRISSGGVSVFGSFDDGGSGMLTDPDTGQPYEVVFVDVNALTVLVP